MCVYVVVILHEADHRNLILHEADAERKALEMQNYSDAEMSMVLNLAMHLSLATPSRQRWNDRFLHATTTNYITYSEIH